MTLADEARITMVVAHHIEIFTVIGDVEGAGAATEAYLQTSLRQRLLVMTS